MIEEWNEFHDWNIRGFQTGKDSLELSVFLAECEKKILFEGVSRCYVGDFLMQNVIYEIKIYDPVASPAAYSEEHAFLSKFALSNLEERKIAHVSASIGAYAVIEFSKVTVTS